MTTITAQRAQTQFESLLRQTHDDRRRFIITENRQPTAILMSLTEFDDIMEELDDKFQKSIERAAQEIKDGKGMTMEQLKSSLKRKGRRK